MSESDLINASEAALIITERRIQEQIMNYQICQNWIHDAIEKGDHNSPCPSNLRQEDINKLKRKGYKVSYVDRFHDYPNRRPSGCIWVNWDHLMPVEQVSTKRS